MRLIIISEVKRLAAKLTHPYFIFYPFISRLKT